MDCLMQDIWTRNEQHLAIIQEPYIGNSKGPKGVPAGFDCLYGGNYPRAAIVAYKCNLLLCSSYSSRDVTTCQTLLEDGKEVYIVSVYCDITQQSLPAELDKLLLEKSDANIIIGLDANSHSPMWGCNETNKRGEMMEDFIMDHNLQVCNRGN